MDANKHEFESMARKTGRRRRRRRRQLSPPFPAKAGIPPEGPEGGTTTNNLLAACSAVVDRLPGIMKAVEDFQRLVVEHVFDDFDAAFA